MRTEVFHSVEDTTGFKDLCLRYANIMTSVGRKATPFDAAKLTRFKEKPASLRDLKIRALTAEILCLESMIADGISIYETKVLIDRFAAMMGYTIQPDFLRKIDPGDVAVIYTHAENEQHQLFRNARSFELTSFSIEELVCMDWTTAYLHEPEFRNDLIEAITHCLSAPRPATICFHPRLHVMTENGSAKKYTISTTMKYLSPLMQGGQIKAFLSTHNTRVIASAK